LHIINIAIIFATDFTERSRIYNYQLTIFFIMKKIGSVVEFTPQRDEELLKAFKSQLHLLGTIPLQEIFTRAAMQPASRFWVSERRAMIVISKMIKGDRILSMNPKKREMFYEIYRRVRSIIKDEPDITLTEATFRAVNSQAPEFYLTPKSARAMIYRLRA